MIGFQKISTSITYIRFTRLNYYETLSADLCQ